MTTPDDKIRCFVAIPLPPPLKQLLEGLKRDWPRDIARNTVRWTPAEQLHLTLLFLGNIPSTTLPEAAENLHRACLGHLPLTLTLSTTGAFPHPDRPRVLWVGLTGDLEPLTRLQADVVAHLRELGEHREDKPFKPHLTVGRTRATPRELRPIGAWWKQQALSGEHSWAVTQVDLMESQLTPSGAIHHRRESVPLS